MIRAQRRRHFVLWCILGPAVLVGLVIAVMSQRPVAVETFDPLQETSVEEEP